MGQSTFKKYELDEQKVASPDWEKGFENSVRNPQIFSIPT
jgi:hypothetical protein